MANTHPLTFVEIDIPYCGHVFGFAPCTATGADKCFNTRNNSHDCEDPANYFEEGKTIRFAVDSGFLPSNIDAIPSLISAEMSPAKIDIGESIGQRATLTCRFKNHKHGDFGLDKNIISRSYNAYETGTFWGKFAARNPYLFRRPIRLIQGYLGQSLAEMDTYHFVVESFNGPDGAGNVSITGVDFLRLLDAETSQIPRASLGRLDAAITSSATSATLTPTGVGDQDYPASGTAIIGDEIVTFTRVADALTLVRGTNGTTADDHDDDETFQLCYVAAGLTEAEIINEMITEYSGLDSSYIPLTDWEAEADNYSGIIYTGIIPKPMGVKAAIDEFVKQSAVILYADIKEQKLRMNVIRPVTPSAAELSDANCLEGINVASTGKRASQVWTYYNQKNKAEALNSEKNYLNIYATVDGSNPHGVETIKKIYSRWLPPAAFSAADNISSRILSRYRVAPRAITRRVPRGLQSWSLGQAVNVVSRVFENAFGYETAIPCQITSIRFLFDSVELTLEEMNFAQDLLSTDRVFVFDYNILDVNLRDVHDSVYSSLTGTPIVRFIVNSGVAVGASTNTGAGMTSGTWGAIAPEVINNGYIVGKGGDVAVSAVNGGDGGLAIYVTDQIEVINNGIIGGGGGSGGSRSFGGSGPSSPGGFVSGGGGAGYNYGKAVPDYPYVSGGEDGTVTDGGAAGDGTAGDGGDLGQAGQNASSGSGTLGTGGAAGGAVDGDSLITWTTLGTIHGTRIN
jgi:hypothetical protein